MSIDIDSKVVGYVSYKPGHGMFCTDRACLVAGSADVLRERICGDNPPSADVGRIMKACFGEIAMVVELGGPYAFDLPAYRRFYALAQRAKKPWDLIDPDKVRLDMVRVEIIAPAH